MKKNVAPDHRSETAPRYHGVALRSKVLEAAEAEVEARYVKVWGGHRAPLGRPKNGWLRYARSMGRPLPGLAARRRFHALRSALVNAVREAKADRDAWRRLLEESPALESVAFKYEAWTIADDDELELVAWRMKTLCEDIGPTWRKRQREDDPWPDHPPRNRDFALQIILSGFISPRWPLTASGAMKVSEAIECVVDAVRTHRREHARR